MKVILDTNIYIKWIRDYQYSNHILNNQTIKYLSSIVLFELYAGAKSVKAKRTIDKIEKVYFKTNRIVAPSFTDYKKLGIAIASFPKNLTNKIKQTSFVNDFLIALNAISIGAYVITENQRDFILIKNYLHNLKIIFPNIGD